MKFGCSVKRNYMGLGRGRNQNVTDAARYLQRITRFRSIVPFHEASPHLFPFPFFFFFFFFLNTHLTSKTGTGFVFHVHKKTGTAFQNKVRIRLKT